MKLLQRGLAAALAIALGAGLVSCGDPRPRLHVFNWGDYLNPELVRRFEQEHGCRVVIDTFDSNEAMLAKLQAGARGYDILVPSSYMVSILVREGMLRELDHGLLPNLEHVDRGFLNEMAFDKEMRYSVPYMMAPTAIAWIDGRVEDPLESWSMFAREELRGRTTLLNDPRETIGAALKTLGFSLNTLDDAELAAARDLVIEWRQFIAKFESDQYRAGIASEEFLLVHGYAGDLFQALESNDRIRIAVPQEGTSISCDDLVIPIDAPQPELAHAFINYLTDPAVAAENMEYIYYLAPNTAAYDLVDESLLAEPAIFIAPDIFARSEMIADLGPEGNAKYARIWDEIRNAPVR